MNKIILCLLLAVNSIILISQSSKACKEVSNQYNVREISLKDSAFYTVLDKVLKLENDNNKYYTSAVSFSIGVYNSDDMNIIKIEGSDNLGIFIERKELIGFFEYKEHKFFLLTAYDEFFQLLIKLKNLKLISCEILLKMTDGRFTILVMMSLTFITISALIVKTHYI